MASTVPSTFLRQILGTAIPEDRMAEFEHIGPDLSLEQFRHIPTGRCIFIDPKTSQCMRRVKNGTLKPMNRPDVMRILLNDDLWPKAGSRKKEGARIKLISKTEVYISQRTKYIKTLLKYNGNYCAICRLPMVPNDFMSSALWKQDTAISVDHIQPVSDRGRRADINNLRLTHALCNKTRDVGPITDDLIAKCHSLISDLFEHKARQPGCGIERAVVETPSGREFHWVPGDIADEFRKTGEQALIEYLIKVVKERILRAHLEGLPR